MGWLDNLAGAALQKLVKDEQAALLQVALDLFREHGGIAGLVQLFAQQGLQAELDSWVKGEHLLPIDSLQVRNLLGEQSLARILANCNLGEIELLEKAAQKLPGMVRQLCPDGKLPANSAELMTRAMQLLK